MEGYHLAGRTSNLYMSKGAYPDIHVVLSV